MQLYPFQYEGVTQLTLRSRVVLADEMGLGKTMQAITSARLLLRSGEVRSLLLIFTGKRRWPHLPGCASKTPAHKAPQDRQRPSGVMFQPVSLYQSRPINRS